jgi:sec-independent protein translocase protein TatC
MFVLAQLGIFNVDHFVATRKIAYFIMVIVVAVITPAVDMFSLLLIWIPMCLMYELGILMIRYYLPKEEPVEETPFDPADLFMFSEDDAEARKNGQQK